MEVAAKLVHLVPHWIEHNASHAEQFEHWAGQAQVAGLDEVAEQIRSAAEAMNQANKYLNRAERLLCERNNISESP